MAISFGENIFLTSAGLRTYQRSRALKKIVGILAFAARPASEKGITFLFHEP